mmetsp:Transcript_8858/g.17561  ORF Transcript_8858/g.17561 Transcript_8858/m.17561 type:complete len:108 (-) Transcript_8858:209-532(-)
MTSIITSTPFFYYQCAHLHIALLCFSTRRTPPTVHTQSQMQKMMNLNRTPFNGSRGIMASMGGNGMHRSSFHSSETLCLVCSLQQAPLSIDFHKGDDYLAPCVSGRE